MRHRVDRAVQGDAASAMVIIERLRARALDICADTDRSDLVSFSAGIVSSDVMFGDVDAMISCADHVFYRAKAASRSSRRVLFAAEAGLWQAVRDETGRSHFPVGADALTIVPPGIASFSFPLDGGRIKLLDPR